VMKSRHALIAVSSEHARGHGAATRVRHTSRALLAGLLAVVWSLASPSMASASLLSPEAEDKVAGIVTIFVLFVVPVVLVTLFWMVHVLPEKIAHKRHHPQLEGIRTLCFLSLAFGGLLWPLAWLWAYTKPVGYKLAYGTDKHPDYYQEHPEEAAVESQSVTLGLHDRGAANIRERLVQLEERGVPAAELKALRADLDALEARVAHADNEAR
jgi:CBS domain containing-hemolysin-like protein